jgi:hypothetical protein
VTQTTKEKNTGMYFVIVKLKTVNKRGNLQPSKWNQRKISRASKTTQNKYS